jgi:hypothetical protein
MGFLSFAGDLRSRWLLGSFVRRGLKLGSDVRSDEIVGERVRK